MASNFCARAGGSSQRPEIRPRGSVAIGDMVQTGSVTINAGDTVTFRVLDRGSDGLHFTLTNTKDPTKSAAVTSKLVTDAPNDYYHVLFYNHQYADGRDYLSYLDNVAVVAPASIVTDRSHLSHRDNVATAASRSLVTDGSFEDAGVTQSVHASGAPAASSIEHGAWQTTGFTGIAAADNIMSNNGKIPDGSRAAFVQTSGGHGGILSQAVSGFQPGREYLVTFWANGRAGPGSFEPTLQVFIDRTQEFLQTITPVEAAGYHTQAYHPESFTFTAKRTTHTIKFQVLAGAGVEATALIDKVSIQEKR